FSTGRKKDRRKPGQSRFAKSMGDARPPTRDAGISITPNRTLGNSPMAVCIATVQISGESICLRLAAAGPHYAFGRACGAPLRNPGYGFSSQHRDFAAVEVDRGAVKPSRARRDHEGDKIRHVLHSAEADDPGLAAKPRANGRLPLAGALDLGADA